MIHTIEFTNYRIFSSPQKLRLAPLTVIFGKNNTGKSAILKLPLLVESALKGNSKEVFTKKINDIRICEDFRDVVFGKANKAVKVKVGNKEGDSLEFSFYVDPSNQNQQTQIESWSITSYNGKNIIVKCDEDNILRTESNNIITFDGIIPKDAQLKEQINGILNRLNFSVDYLGAVRELPKRDYRLHDDKKELVGSRGEYAYDFLIEDKLNGGGKLFDTVSSWYEKTFDGWKVFIDQTHSPVYYIEMQHKNIKNNILDTGVGIVQSMPVIIAATMKPSNNINLNIFEEPETHLHPAAHADMVEYIASQIRLNNRLSLIETHSLNFILRLRLMIASGELSSEDVALYYVEFDKETGTSNLKEVFIKEDGSVSEWPKGVFNEALEETLRLRNAQMHKNNKNECINRERDI